jgi:hypothetical protein
MPPDLRGRPSLAEPLFSSSKSSEHSMWVCDSSLFGVNTMISGQRLAVSDRHCSVKKGWLAPPDLMGFRGEVSCYDIHHD